jgi:hypothetical protein
MGQDPDFVAGGLDTGFNNLKRKSWSILFT